MPKNYGIEFKRGFQPENSVFSTYTPYAWSTLLIEEVDALASYFTVYLPQRYALAIVMLTILSAVVCYNYVVGILLLLTAPLLVLLMILIGWKTQEAQALRFDQLAHLGHQFLDRIKGLSVLETFNQVWPQSLILDQGSQALRKQSMAILKIAFLSSAVLEFFSALSIALAALYLGLSLLEHHGWGYVGGVANLKAALFILIVVPEYFNPLRQFAQAYHSKQAAEAVMRKMTGYQNQYPLPKIVPMHSAAPFTTLTLDKISYTYPRAIVPALQIDHLHISAGKKIAIVGASGSGKTTLLQLLLGALAPDKGKRVWNHTLTPDFHSTLPYMAWAGQDAIWTRGTVGDNLRADTDALPLIYQALAWAGLPSDARFLQKKIGEGGEGLSGGQLQRLALTRAYLKQAPLWLLDEPTAHLDEYHTRALNQRLSELDNTVTLIFTTHKKETALIADRILLLDEGQLVDDDSALRLMNHPFLRGW